MTHCQHLHIASSLIKTNTANEGLPQTCPSPLSIIVRHMAKTLQATTGHNVHSQTCNVLDDLREGHWLQLIVTGLQSPGH